jgi:hypothetical protein
LHWNRPTDDYFLMQERRVQRQLNREVYVGRHAESSDESERAECTELLERIIDGELENTDRLIERLGSDVEFVTVTDLDETPLMHG